MLNHRQTLFVSHYLTTGNATEAYKLAYGASDEVAAVNASKLLRNAKVQEEIVKFKKQVMSNTKVTIESLVTELQKVAFSDIRKVVNDDKGGFEFKKLAELDDITAASVSEISETPSKYGTKKVVKLHSKLDAIDKLMRHLGGYITINEIIDKLTPEQLEELSEKILAKSKSNESK